MPSPSWLQGTPPPIALGCMRLSEAGVDQGRARATLKEALDAGLRIFDTARAYGPSAEQPGHNERLLGEVLRGHPEGHLARVITKGGMRREAGAWLPDGRASAVRADSEASLEALGVPVDLYLLHAPDPRVAWSTQVRALAQLVETGEVRHVGLCNVSRRQLDEALSLAPIAAVQVALGAAHDEALRGGVVARCLELGIAVLAHSPLGGPTRAAALTRDRVLRSIAEARGRTEQEVLLAGLRALGVTPIAGATRPETARSLAEAGALSLSPGELARLSGRRPFQVPVRAPPPAPVADGEVLLLLGLQGAGKSLAVQEWVARGYQRLNRDERGGTLQQLAGALDEALAAGARRVVLDNTYSTRAARRTVLDVAARHRLPVRARLLDTPLPQAQVNVVLRILEKYDRLPEPEQLRRHKDPAVVPPTALFRAARALEPPALDEGFAQVEVSPFTRAGFAPGTPARFVHAEVLDGPRRGEALASTATIALYGWTPGGAPPSTAGRIEAYCSHPAGPPRCWCRPPLPGLILLLARRHGLSIDQSELWGTGAAQRALAAALGMRFVDCG